MSRANARQALQHAASAAWLASRICRSEENDPELQAAAEAAIDAAAELDALADGLPDPSTSASSPDVNGDHRDRSALANAAQL